mmetsp:Transcript_20147/g.51423  ORF Transcript_20147/g.51423 Transcript_20147/m.51423 type:complete len:138 (-) Transcript_20147:97-510(-)
MRVQVRRWHPSQRVSGQVEHTAQLVPVLHLIDCCSYLTHRARLPTTARLRQSHLSMYVVHITSGLCVWLARLPVYFLLSSAAKVKRKGVREYVSGCVWAERERERERERKARKEAGGEAKGDYSHTRNERESWKCVR